MEGWMDIKLPNMLYFLYFFLYSSLYNNNNNEEMFIEDRIFFSILDFQENYLSRLLAMFFSYPLFRIVLAVDISPLSALFSTFLPFALVKKIYIVFSKHFYTEMNISFQTETF